MMECVSKKGEFDPARFPVFEFVDKSGIISFLVLNPVLWILMTFCAFNINNWLAHLL